MSTVHSEIGASGMERWSRCPGSVRLSRGLPKTSSPAAREGTLAHEIAAHVLTHNAWPVGIPALGIEKLGDDELTEEMREGISLYVDECRWDVVPGVKVLTEHSFDLSQLHEGLFGTCDRINYFPDRKLLRVIDFKYGKGIPVEVVENGKPNLQLLYYGLGALVTLDLPVETVELVVVQPRCPHKDGPIRRHTFDAIDMLDFAADLIAAAKATQAPDAPVVPGDHCHFCLAGRAAKCPAITTRATELAKQAFSEAEPYDVKHLAEVLTWIPAIQSWAKNVEEFAYQEALKGKDIPGFKVVAKVGRRQWKADEAEIVEELRSILKLSADHFYEHKLKSPAQVEKMAAKGTKDRVNALSISVSSGTTLVPVSDKRPAVKDAVETVFSEAASPVDASAKEELDALL